MTIAGDQSLLREINRMALVRLVEHGIGLSRADLAKESGLTKSTVGLLVQDLIDDGWIAESDVQARDAAGRRPTPLSLNGQRLAMIGADVSVDSIDVLTVSLTGAILAGASEPLDGKTPEQVIEQLVRMIVPLVRQSVIDGRRLLGIGVGVPGAVLDPQGVVKLAPNLAWRDIPFQADLDRELNRQGVHGLRIQVQNDYDAAVLAEYEFAHETAPDPLICLGLGVGVGAGIIVRDRLFLGAEGYAGEVGHSILQLEGPLCSCGRRGCAEAFIGLRAISSRISGNNDELLTIETLRGLLARKDEAAVLAVRRAGHYLGVLIQNLWTYFNPGRIVLGGPTCELGDPLLSAATSCLERYASDCGLKLPEIQLSRFGAHSIAVGGAALVKHALLRPFDPRFRNR